ncbi:MAG: class I SAM-dependent methyltransferase [Parcubacteria group bacterium]|jgi:ubiquinone/menaquinone biosynthesis C-methylase UbiE
MKTFPESKLAHKYLDGLVGLEIGGSIHNPFGLNTKNVDYSASDKTTFKKEEYDMRGDFLPVDVVAFGDNIPVADESQDFVVSSHVLEHFPDPIKALKEWYRIVKKGGYIFMIVPHKERTFDKDEKRTTLNELLERHNNAKYDKEPSMSGHYSHWITEDIIELVKNINLDWQVVDFQDADDKVGNGFTVVIKKMKPDLKMQKTIERKLEKLKRKGKISRIAGKIITKNPAKLLGNSWREYKRSGTKGIVKRMLQ